jgi:peptide deformylase
MRLVYYPDEILSKQCDQVFFPDSSLKSITDFMIDTMYSNGGVGLAAPQIGILKQIIIVDGSAGQESDQLRIMINPKIFKSSEKMLFSKEGCLSIPETYLEIERPSEIWIRYYDLYGKQQTLMAEGFPATITAHEIDHLNGKTIFDHLKPLTKKIAIKDYTRRNKYLI